MEEDIKILNELIKLYERYSKNMVFTEEDRNNATKRVQAIENILNRLEQLEKENESLVAQYEYQGAIMVNEYMPLETIKELFIPKSVIREKIEELRYKRDKTEITYYLDAQIDMLKELLGGEK